jgi:hypothetical protein
VDVPWGRFGEVEAGEHICALHAVAGWVLDREGDIRYAPTR